MKREYKKLCERQKRQENERWERREEDRLEDQVWKIVNKERRKWKDVNRDIEMEE